MGLKIDRAGFLGAKFSSERSGSSAIVRPDVVMGEGAVNLVIDDGVYWKAADLIEFADALKVLANEIER